MNKTESTTIQLSEIIYLAYFTVMFGARAIGLYEGMLPYNIMLVIGMLLFLLKIAMTRHTFAEYLLMGTLLFISLIVYYNTGEKGLLLYFTMMLGMKNVSLKRVMKWAAAILSISFTVLVFLSVFGWKQDITYLNDRAGFGQVLRQILVEGKAESLFRKRQKQGMRLFFFLLRKLRLRGKMFQHRKTADLVQLPTLFPGAVQVVKHLIRKRFSVHKIADRKIRQLCQNDMLFSALADVALQHFLLPLRVAAHKDGPGQNALLQLVALHLEAADFIP